MQERQLLAPPFKGDFYRAEIEKGGACLLSLGGDALCRLARYELSYGTLHNFRTPVGEDGWVLLDDVEGLHIADQVELRNEFTLGRANLPIRHKCSIVDIRDSSVKIHPCPPKATVFTSPANSRIRPHGSALVRLQTTRLDNFSVRAVEHIDECVSWKLVGSGDVVTLEITLHFQADSPKVTCFFVRQFNISTKVFGERIVWTGLPKLAEVYRKNRQLDVEAFQRRYNLDREGACFQAGPGEGALYVYGDTNATSLELECRDASFALEEITPFRSAPYNLDVTQYGDLNRYAAAASVDGHVKFGASWVTDMELRGVVLRWYKHPAIEVGIEAEVGTSWLKVPCQLDTRSGNYIFEQPIVSRRLRVTMKAGPSGTVSLFAVDFLIGGSSFDLVVNLDDHRDHRFLTFVAPETRTSEPGELTHEIRNASRRHEGEITETRFSLVAGNLPKIRPRILHVPGGAQALLIWTEHADRASLESHYATYYGRSDVSDPEAAVGGFVYHQIPVTKSVFFYNPSQMPCSRSHPVPQVALAESAQFEEFCRALSARGYEICVHAPQPRDAPTVVGKYTAAWFAKNFGSRTWIDHMARLVHCGMSGQGMKETSKYYMAPTWHAEGFKYFWQFASEDAAETANVQMPRWGDWLHAPILWRHPTETDDFISWPTMRGSYLARLDANSLAELVTDWGVCITHTYPPAHYDDPKKSEYMARNAAGVLVTTPQFEEVLRNVASLKSRGELAVLCVRDAMSYLESIQAIDIIHSPDGGVSLRNPLDSTIRGFSFVVPGAVDVVPEGSRTRKVGNETIVTLDFPADATIDLDDENGRKVMTIEVPHEVDSEACPEIGVDLGFGPDCREEEHPMLASIKGMIRSGFIADQARNSKQGIVASLSLRDYTYESYVAAIRKHGNANAVREARKAKNAGYVVEPFPRQLFIPDIYAINTSAPARGGEPMRDVYLRSIGEMGGAPRRDIPLRKPKCTKHHQTMFGVFRPNPGHMQGEVKTDRQLVAYLSVNRYGNCAIYSTLLGHHAYLRDGIMSLLHLEVVRSLMHPEDETLKGIDYLMYHRYHNAHPGLTAWKKHRVFRPAYWINKGLAIESIEAVTASSAAAIVQRELDKVGQTNRPKPELSSAKLKPLSEAEQDAFDKQYGTDTSGTYKLSELTIDSQNVDHGLSYQTTTPRIVTDIVKFLGIDPSEFTFVDIGAGKGRMLLAATQQGFSKAIGVEFASELVAIANKNIERLDAKTASIELGDAANFAFPNEDMVVYMYNPFDVTVMRKVVDNLASVTNKRLYVVYRNPKARELLDSCNFLTLLGVVKGWEGENGVYVWSREIQSC